MRRRGSRASPSVRRGPGRVKLQIDQSPKGSEPRHTHDRIADHRRGDRGGWLRHPHRQVRQTLIVERDDVHALAIGRQLPLDLQHLPV